jgi:hypothetical protein
VVSIMKNLVQLLVAVMATSAFSQMPVNAADEQKNAMYIIGSDAPLPTRPNREMLGALPMPTKQQVSEQTVTVATGAGVTTQVQLRAPIEVTTAKGW